ncbi:hypothetical protein [Flexithrix dorotheae]|uniref:hypothetical protein n=1 Tax=Flexithrix dorotheae TaxID=70993 RepID=UPI0003788208|nr:hypothetical protein [Flexithrix dorotheae]
MATLILTTFFLATVILWAKSEYGSQHKGLKVFGINFFIFLSYTFLILIAAQFMDIQTVSDESGFFSDLNAQSGIAAEVAANLGLNIALFSFTMILEITLFTFHVFVFWLFMIYELFIKKHISRKVLEKA